MLNLDLDLAEHKMTLKTVTEDWAKKEKERRIEEDEKSEEENDRIS